MKKEILLFLFIMIPGSYTLALVTDLVSSKEEVTVKEEKILSEVEKLKSTFNYSEEQARTIITLIEQVKQSNNQIIVAKATGDLDLEKVIRLEFVFYLDLTTAYISFAKNQVKLKELTHLSEISSTNVPSDAKNLKNITVKTSLLFTKAVMSGTEWAEAQINFVCLKQKDDCKNAFKEYVNFMLLLTSSMDSAIKPIIFSDFVKKVKY